MNCKRETTQYDGQLENGIAEMEATIERLRGEIYELIEKRNALLVLNVLLKSELKEML